MYSNIRIVLINTSHPGNIGAAARAMKTMCLDSLWLVDPHGYPSAEATARASGADDLLANARVCSGLDEAIADCHLVIGASARLRSIPCPAFGPRDCGIRVWQESESGRVAVVFGREQSGLSNQELDRCHHLVHVPANPEYPSLNLAAAVQLIAYEIHMAALSAKGTGQLVAQDRRLPADGAEMERLYGHLEQTLIELDFLNPDNPRQLMRRLRRLFNRAQPDANEVNILRGILGAAQGKRDPNRFP